MHEGFGVYPIWLERSGLPRALNESCKSPLAWTVFKKIVELDCASNRQSPGLVEVSLERLGELTGLPPAKVEQNAKKLRKAGFLRAFLPDNEEEDALFQVAAPLQTPVSWEELRKTTPEWFEFADWQFRYATETPEDIPVRPDEKQVADPKLREVVDLYFDNVSMKMNSMILDQLVLISRRFDIALIRRVFAKARQREVQGLSWILSEARREQIIKEKAEKAREEPGS